jgi:hypothetical protein
LQPARLRLHRAPPAAHRSPATLTGKVRVPAGGRPLQAHSH